MTIRDHRLDLENLKRKLIAVDRVLTKEGANDSPAETNKAKAARQEIFKELKFVLENARSSVRNATKRIIQLTAGLAEGKKRACQDYKESGGWRGELASLLNVSVWFNTYDKGPSQKGASVPGLENSVISGAMVAMSDLKRQIADSAEGCRIDEANQEWEERNRQEQQEQATEQREVKKASTRSRMLRIAENSRGMCDQRLDYLFSLSPQEAQIELSKPNVFSCTGEGVRRWQEKRRKREAEARALTRRIQAEQRRMVREIELRRETCFQIPGWVFKRIEKNPQSTNQRGPYAPLAVPFTNEEVRSAVLKVVAAADGVAAAISGAARYGKVPGGGCSRSVGAADVRIAQYVAEYLTRHKNLRWIKLVFPSGPGGRRTRLRYVDLKYMIARVFGDGRVTAPTDQQAQQRPENHFDLQNFNTTYSLQLRLQGMPGYLDGRWRSIASAPLYNKPNVVLTEEQRVAVLERQLAAMRQQATPEPDRDRSRSFTRTQALMRQIEALGAQGQGAAPARESGRVPWPASMANAASSSFRWS